MLASAVQMPFFGIFAFHQYEPATALGNGLHWHGFRPQPDRSRQQGEAGGGATLNLEIDASGHIVSATLCLDHVWIAGPSLEARRKARRMAAGYLRWALSPRDRAAVIGLIEEIDGSAGDDDESEGMPQFPSPGYRSYLGYQEFAEQELADCDLRIANRNWHRRDAAAAAPPGYDAETSWLWITVRRGLPAP